MRHARDGAKSPGSELDFVPLWRKDERPWPYKEPMPTTYIVYAVFGPLSLACYVACFILAGKTGKLKATDWIIGTLGLLCGFGFFYFIYRANDVTLKHSFDLIEKGGDAAESRKLNSQFKMAAGGAIAFGVI